MLFGNSFSGLLPWSWSKLTGLLSLSVGENTLHDRLPESWSALQHLHNLDLSVNSLEGSCPSKWSALADISHISLSFNLFAGHLPEEWSRLTNLKELSLSSNLFSGTLPSMWSALTGLRVLELGNNLVSGSIPLMWGHGLQNLRRLDLGWNSMLRGCLPEQWADLERRNQIFLQGTGIYGTGSCPLSSGDSSGADVPHLIPLAPPSPPEPVPTDRCGGPGKPELLVRSSLHIKHCL